MYCNQQNSIIDTLLKFKDEPNNNNNNNKIASIIRKPHDKRTKVKKEELAIHVINNIGSSLDLDNKT
jgi:hypothetical protein